MYSTTKFTPKNSIHLPLNVPRLSGASDNVRVMVSERLIMDGEYCIGDMIEVTGQFRSYNSYENGDNRLVLTVFAKDICHFDEEESKNPNTLFLNGFICKEPVYRTTPFGREITDILLAVNRSYNKSDYIPIIAWGRNARFAKNLHVGDNVKIWGRIQSRTYQNVSAKKKQSPKPHTRYLSIVWSLLKKKKKRNKNKEQTKQSCSLVFTVLLTL